jgi:uncharacterized membrane protein
MTLYRLCIVLHVAAASLWLGHMFFWSLFSGPVLKSIEPRETAQSLRELSFWMGGLGWPALAVLVATGTYMLGRHGITWRLVASGDILDLPFGRILAVKLALVVAMIGYQAKFGHRPAPRANYLNMMAAVLILTASVLLAR